MMHYYKHHHFRKGEDAAEEDEESQSPASICANFSIYKRTRPKLLSLLLLSLISCCWILFPHLFSSSSIPAFYTYGESEAPVTEIATYPLSSSSVSNGTIYCDRSSIRTDICFMKEDVRTRSASSSIFLYTSNCTEEHEENEEQELHHEKIKPYTRKWETSIMNTIIELNLISKRASSGTRHQCDVRHDVPALFFSTGGYTGNVYHEFNDGILPLYITSQHMNKKVIFVILEYHNWWVTKYGDILSLLSDYPPIDFSTDKRTHCFPEAIVGLRIHDELTVDSSLMEGNKSIADFRNLLDMAYWPRIRGLVQDEEREARFNFNVNLSLSPSTEEIKLKKPKPKLVILSRNGSREITNEASMVKMAEEVGFFVEILRPDRTTELAKVYRALNSSDVMIGVHGAAMTHFLFLKPGSVFIQIIPLGTEWAAETYYGEPAVKLGLKYIRYKVLPTESSLYGQYDRNDPVLANPRSVTKKGWQFTKEIYLDGQNVRLNLNRFRLILVCAYDFKSKRNARI